MSAVRKIGPQGAVLIPVELCEQLGLQEGTAVSIEAAGDGLLIRPLRIAPSDAQREAFLDAVNKEYAALRKDTVAWERELAERRSMEGTLLDGLEEVDEAWLAGWLADDDAASQR